MAQFLNSIILRGIFSVFSSVEPASFQTKCHTAGEGSRGIPQAKAAECWFSPSERNRREVLRGMFLVFSRLEPPFGSNMDADWGEEEARTRARQG